MISHGFFYRRLGRFFPCVLRISSGFIRLKNKHEIASCQDVFCGPFYWQVFGHLGSAPPRTVVDAGANVGHFSILVNCCIETRYGNAETTQFYLIEPNTSARKMLEKNMIDAGMSRRSRVLAGALGKKSGLVKLFVNRRSFLTSRVVDNSDDKSKYSQVPLLDLNEIVKGPIDILKVDIEGSEYDFLTDNPEILCRTNLFLLELHQTDPSKREQMLNVVKDAGLKSVAPPLPLHGQELFIFQR